MKIISLLKKIYNKLFGVNDIELKGRQYMSLFEKNSFHGIECLNYQHYEAVITRLYHTVEKGLCFKNYRAGFGNKTISEIVLLMNNYSKCGYSVETDFYKTALSVLDRYIKKNEKYGYINDELNTMFKELPGVANERGGVIKLPASINNEEKNFKELLETRHSIRFFSDKDVDISKIITAIELSQLTPSACNRQAWSTLVIKNKNIIKSVLENQNGNSGFGDFINVLLLVVSDLRYFNNDRELFQPFIDGGMYAQNLLNSLAYYNLASCPLSASLTKIQEQNIRKILDIEESKVFVLFIGVGNYCDENITTMSSRRKAEIKII